MKNLVIEVSEELKQAWPQFRGAAVFATVKILPIMRNCGNVLTSLLCYTVLNIPPTPSKKCRPFRQPGRLIKNVEKIPVAIVLLQKPCVAVY